MSVGICPLCQQANACALANTSGAKKTAQQPHCWCFDQRLNMQQKKRLAHLDKQDCVCQSCLEKLKTYSAQTLAP